MLYALSTRSMECIDAWIKPALDHHATLDRKCQLAHSWVHRAPGVSLAAPAGPSTTVPRCERRENPNKLNPNTCEYRALMWHAVGTFGPGTSRAGPWPHRPRNTPCLRRPPSRARTFGEPRLKAVGDGAPSSNRAKRSGHGGPLHTITPPCLGPWPGGRTPSLQRPTCTATCTCHICMHSADTRAGTFSFQIAHRFISLTPPPPFF